MTLPPRPCLLVCGSTLFALLVLPLLPRRLHLILEVAHRAAATLGQVVEGLGGVVHEGLELVGHGVHELAEIRVHPLGGVLGDLLTLRVVELLGLLRDHVGQARRRVDGLRGELDRSIAQLLRGELLPLGQRGVMLGRGTVVVARR